HVLTHTLHYGSGVFETVGAEHPRIARNYHHVDAATIYLVTDPARYDVIVTDNLFGDILTDLAGAVTGGIGLAASANLNPARTGPSMFEPVHGAAHDIAGTGTANPCAAIRSAALMLEHLGEAEAARRVADAVLAQQREMAGDDQPWKTASIGDAVARRL
ncbi:MAG TPA: isocitrate/isopropylmalate family dehydrogenase, partial [Acidimicrobiales bacterium]|nr:isocitrate/isopropylmalate family dehydrogenase [Acidimicrobiales bacterium]